MSDHGKGKAGEKKYVPSDTAVTVAAWVLVAWFFKQLLHLQR